MNPTPARTPALDGLRGIAIIGVVCSHLTWQLATPDLFDRILVTGWVGVDLFFVLSGFLITGILCDTRHDRSYFRSFYVRRGLRIFPAYYLALVVLFIVVPRIVALKHEYISHTYRYFMLHQKWYWAYLVNVHQAQEFTRFDRLWAGHFWTLSIEEQFYLVWPAVVWVVGVRRLPAVCVALIVTAVLGRFWYALHDNPFPAHVLTWTRLDSLGAGALLAAMGRVPGGAETLRRWYLPVGIASGVVAVGLHIGYGTTPLALPMLTAGLLAHALATAALIVAIVEGRHRLQWLSHPWLGEMGIISYGLYICHFPLLTLLSPVREYLYAWGAGSAALLFVAHVGWMALGFTVSIIVASLSYRFFERPILRLKDRWAPHSRTSVALEPVAVAP